MMKKFIGLTALMVLVVVALCSGSRITSWAAEKVMDLSRVNKIDENIEANENDSPTWWLGISLGAVPPPVRAQLIEGLLDETDGVYVAGVLPGSPAEKGGLKMYDIVTQVGAQKVNTAVDLTDIIRKTGNVELTLAVIRGGAPTTVKVTPEAMPEEVKQQQRIMQQGLGGFQQMAPGGIQIQIPQGAFQIQVPQGGAFNIQPGLPRNAVPQHMRKMLEETFGEDFFADEDEDGDEDGDENKDTSDEPADPENAAGKPKEDSQAAEGEDDDIIINKRAVKPADGKDGEKRQGRFRLGVPGVQFGGGVSISKTMISQLGGKQLQVSINRTNDNPADVHVKWGEDEYKTTEKDLDILPDDLKGKVEQMLKDDVKVSGFGLNAPPKKAEPKAEDAEKELKVSKEKVIDLNK